MRRENLIEPFFPSEEGAVFYRILEESHLFQFHNSTNKKS